jgi:hypothetical protein
MADTLFNEVTRGVMLSNTIAFSPLHLKYKKCSWCNSIIKIGKNNFCSEDCKIEDKEYHELRRIKKLKEYSLNRAKPLGEEKRKKK